MFSSDAQITGWVLSISKLLEKFSGTRIPYMTKFRWCRAALSKHISTTPLKQIKEASKKIEQQSIILKCSWIPFMFNIIYLSNRTQLNLLIKDKTFNLNTSVILLYFNVPDFKSVYRQKKIWTTLIINNKNT